jgi:hypothetical protein
VAALGDGTGAGEGRGKSATDAYSAPGLDKNKLIRIFLICLEEANENHYYCISTNIQARHAMAALSAVIVGADRLGNIPDLLRGHNISITHHISGRDPSHQKRGLQLPTGTQILILLTDFLGHNVMKTFRHAAQRAGIRVVACRRSVCSMQQALNQCGLCAQCPDRCPERDKTNK